MKSRVITACMLALALNACQENEKQPKKDETPPPKYFPVAEYIRKDIKAAANEPIGIKRYITIGGKEDSSYISQEEMDRLATEAFLVKDVEKENFERSFKENAFMDETTQMITFNYQSNDSNSVVKRVDVLLTPGSETDNVRTIYMEKMYSNKDTAIIQRMFWKRAWFKIVTLKTLGNNTPDIETLVVGWDPTTDYKK